ncbi:MAG TPA: acyl-CoA synthetase [Ktedonobacterales bacterium]|jgi:fatty-acyl-CoA synthase|nr:acyl-CoA synthetase [Ktedonobacterales bacterium]
MLREIHTLGDIEAIEQVPLSERQLPGSTYEMVRRSAERFPDRTALRFFLTGDHYDHPASWTYHELLGGIHQTANMFHDLGIGREDVVSLLLPNCPQILFSLFGGEAAGVVNPINPLLEPEQIAEIMNAAGAKVLVTLAPFPRTDIWEKAEKVCALVPTLQTVLQVDLGMYLPSAQRVLVSVALGRKRRAARNAVKQRVTDFDALRVRYPSDRLQTDRTLQPDDIASLFHTGGTTGAPKLAQHTHANEVFDTWVPANMVPLSEQDVMLCGLPLFHVNGVVIMVMIPLSIGATAVLATPAGYRTRDLLPNFWKIIEYYHVTFFSGVPTVFSVLLDKPVGKANISSLRYALCGAAPMPVEVFQAFEKRTGIRILEGYGMTEGTCVSSVNPSAGERRVGSVGYRMPYMEMKTVQLDAKGEYVRDCGADAIGTVAMRGPHVFPGYKQAHHNKGAWIHDGSDAPWLNTGDLGRFDNDGYLWLTGRQKELIIRGGHNIDPQAIEGPLYKHPAVALVGAVGRPDLYAGEVPVVYVSLKPGASATPEELQTFLEEHIGERAAIPKTVKIIDEIPTTAVGKIFKPRLRYREIQDVYTQELAALGGSVRQFSIVVGPDNLRGTVAHIKAQLAPGGDVEQVRAQIVELLERYTIPYDIVFE